MYIVTIRHIMLKLDKILKWIQLVCFHQRTSFSLLVTYYVIYILLFHYRYYNPGVYEKLLYTKRIWDPYNKFNHCQSIGNEDESCCPAWFFFKYTSVKHIL